MRLKFWIVPLCMLHILMPVRCSWGAPGSGQYHIQTDEGPERYFRFQTDNGQFRKEKRLQDGTVIGTEAWIDAAGYLRQKDYIADDQGYRILKSKTVYVGVGRQIEDAIKSTKSTPARTGTLVEGKHGFNARKNSVDQQSSVYKQNSLAYYSTTSSSSSSTTAQPPRANLAEKLNYLSPIEAAKIEPSAYLGFDHYPNELPAASRHRHRQQNAQYYAEKQRVPLVQLRHHSEPFEDPNNSIASDYSAATLSSTTERVPLAPPSLEIEPPLSRGNVNRRVRPIAIVSTTPTPIAYENSTPRTDAGYYYARVPSTTPSQSYAAQKVAYENAAALTPALPVDVNNLEGLLPPLTTSRHRTYQPYRRLQPIADTSANIVHSNSLLNEPYDGIATTRNGFRYVLPKQYHEEEQISSHKKAGSYGYVDPFGIRRVVYYNASPERGFVHRNNNQYVGHGAAPYDSPSGP